MVMEAKKYRKKPVVIEAIQWNGRNLSEVKEFVGQAMERKIGRWIETKKMDGVMTEEIIIHTLEGDMRADLNDFIIKGVNGEFYPCKPNIFSATYEEC